MNLKRDTEYALRIALEFGAQTQLSNRDMVSISLLELCKKTNVPRQIVKRLCEKMCDVGWLYIENPNDTFPNYLVRRDIETKTIYDIIALVEDCVDLFFVFDHKDVYYNRHGRVFDDINAKVTEALSEKTMKEILTY